MFTSLLVVARPLPWQVRLHGRSKTSIKLFFFWVFEGEDGTGYGLLFCPALPPLVRFWSCLCVSLSLSLSLLSLRWFTEQTSFATKANWQQECRNQDCPSRTRPLEV
uniref:Uncharacterized protein n=1 Tax=Manihot esculenta TaxID=3983 RepID=A0A2C9TZS7_MANES